MSEPFADVIGHETVVELLRRDAEGPAQAYLFTGADGVGKATVALEFAVLLLCPEGDERCRRLVRSGTHPDLVVVEPEGATSLGVDQTRAMVSRAALLPVESSRTVFLLPEAGSMTDQAANALLKTLEEPATSVVFLLAAGSEDDFPATIASRCRTVHLGRVPSPVLVEGLVARGLAELDAQGVAAVAGGRPGLGMSLMAEPEVARFRELWLSVPERVTPRPGDGLRLAREVLAELGPLVDQAVAPDLPKEMRQRAARRAEQSLLINGLEILASWYSDSASLQMGGPVKNADLPLGPFTDITPRKAVSSADRVLDAVVDIQLNLRRELVLSDLFAELGSEA